MPFEQYMFIIDGDHENALFPWRFFWQMSAATFLFGFGDNTCHYLSQ